MRHKKWAAALLCALLLFPLTFAGCKKSILSAETTKSGQNALSSSEINTEFSARDLDVGYEDSTATHITLEGNSIRVSGQGAAASGSTLTISKGGVYVVAGTLENGQILISAGEADKIQLVLNGVSLHCETSAPIYIKKADKVFVTLAENTVNTVSDGSQYTLSEEDSTVDGALFSKADLTVNGSGSLNVTAAYKHGIVSKDDLVITGGTIAVTANGQGLSGKDCVKIADGVFVLNTQTDGIQSSNEDDAQKGYVYIRDGTFTINAQTDGIQAAASLRIDGGKFTIKTGGGSANASTDAKGDSRPGWGSWGKATDSATDTASAKGLKAGGELTLSGGVFSIDSSDDSLHSNANVSIQGGELLLRSGDDGIHADASTTISGGKITITKSYEGIEGANVTIRGGTVLLTASDDGINAAGGSDGSSVNGRPGQNNMDKDSEYYIRISGGSLTVNASGDGLDANGSLFVEGGTTYINGPTSSGNGALDYDGTATITGGILVAVGSTGMAQGGSESSSQCSLLYNFSSNLSAGTALTLKDADGTAIVSFTPEKTYQSVLISASGMNKGETYTLTAGSQSVEVTLNAIATSGGSQSRQGGGAGRR